MHFFCIFFKKDGAFRLRPFFDQPKVFKLWEPPFFLNLYSQVLAGFSFLERVAGEGESH
jgi:hypothetical protein